MLQKVQTIFCIRNCKMKLPFIINEAVWIEIIRIFSLAGRWSPENLHLQCITNVDGRVPIYTPEKN
jgi:hypothetical protein